MAMTLYSHEIPFGCNIIKFLLPEDTFNIGSSDDYLY